MPATRLSLHAGGYDLDVAEDGSLIDLRPAGSAQIVLARVGLRAVVADRPVAWAERTVRTDEDETETTARTGALRVDLRHSFAIGWTTRLVLTNTGDEPFALDNVVVELRAGDAVTGWQLSAGSAAWFALLPAAGPVLAGHTATGWIESVEDDGLHLGPLLLAPAERRILRVVWDWTESPAVLRRRLPDWMPARTVAVGEADLALPADPDRALWLGADGGADRIWVEDSAADRTLVRGAFGRTPVELRSARGTAVLELGWAPSPEAILVDCVREVLARPRTRAGLAVLGSIDEALAMQRVLVGTPGVDRDDLVEALDLFTAREVDPRAAADPWRCCFLVGEATRQADDDRLSTARDEHAALVAAARRSRRLPAGLGLATIRLSVALMVAGADFRGPVDAVSEVLADPGLQRDLAWWEARLATTADPGDARDLVGYGRSLGTVLPGRATAAAEPAVQAQSLAVLRLLPDAATTVLATDWGLTPAQLVERSTADLCVRLYDRPAGPALRWLAVADASE